MASHTTCNAALIDALKQLRARWSRVRETWQDDAAATFGPFAPSSRRVS
jgi:hypothetical protein